MMWARWSLLAGLTLLAAVAPLAAWDADLELLDLVEEIPETFYRFLSVEQDATSTEIKKAYRRLSLVLHPDKNKDEDAENQFRQLVAIYEVLKDEERRRTYDDILVNGLPDWRQPVFYYRRVRKLSNAELLFLLCLILTVGHYAVIWSIYLEKQLDEMLSSKKKKEKKKKPNPRPADEPSPRAQERPQWQDILPLKISIWLYLSIKNLPQTIQELKLFYEEYQQLKQQQREEEEEAEQEVTPREKRPKVKKPKVEFPVYEASERLHGDEQTRLHGYDQALEEIEDQMDDWLQEGGRKKVTGWTEEDISFLSRLMVKFPGGTPGRWDKIAVELGRSVAEVTTKVKQVKDNVSNTSGLVKLSELKSPPLPLKLLPDELMTQRGGVASEQEEEAAATVRKRNKKPAAASNPGDGDLKVRSRRQRDFDPTAAETEEEGPIKGEGLKRGEGPIQVSGNGCGLTKGEGLSKGCGLTKGEGLSKEEESNESKGACPDRADPSLWSQNQQKLLELALTQFPRGTAERWDRVAKVVPGKTKEECMHRFKMLAELIQKKKASKS